MVKRYAMSLAGALAVSPAVALANEYVLVGSWASGDVRRYRLDGSLVDTFIPARSGGLSYPDGMAYGADGDLYISDATNARVLQYNGTTGAFKRVFASTGLTRAGFNAFGPDGSLYVCSSGADNAVHRYDPVTGAHLGAFAAAAGLTYPAGLSWNAGVMYVSGFSSGQIERFDATTGARIDTLISGLNRPLYSRLGSNGDLYVSEYGANRLDRISLASRAIVGSVTGSTLKGPVGQLAMRDGSLLVTSWNNGRVLRYDESTGAFLGTFESGYPQGNDILLTPDITPAPGTVVALGTCALSGVGRRRRAHG